MQNWFVWLFQIGCWGCKKSACIRNHGPSSWIVWEITACYLTILILMKLHYCPIVIPVNFPKSLGTAMISHTCFFSRMGPEKGSHVGYQLGSPRNNLQIKWSLLFHELCENTLGSHKVFSSGCDRDASPIEETKHSLFNCRTIISNGWILQIGLPLRNSWLKVLDSVPILSF